MAVVELASQIIGDGPPLIILHGLFGSGHNWGRMARGLADIRQVHSLDLRNHGSSPWTTAMTYPDMASDVAAYAERRGLIPCDVLGHSMGGKTAMTLALTRPELVERLIIVDIAPVSYAGANDHSGQIAAMRSLDLSILSHRAEIDRHLASGLPDPVLRAFLMQNLVRDGSHFRWRINLEGIEASLPALVGFPGISASFTGPTTFFAGETSNFIRPRDEAEMQIKFPHCRLIEVGDSGHTPHADHPDKFLNLLRTALT